MVHQAEASQPHLYDKMISIDDETRVTLQVNIVSFYRRFYCYSSSVACVTGLLPVT